MSDATQPGRHAASPTPPPSGAPSEAPSEPASASDDATMVGIHEPYGPWLIAADRAAGTQPPQNVGPQAPPSWAAPTRPDPEQAAPVKPQGTRTRRRIIVWVIVVLVLAALVAGAFVARAMLAKGKYGPQHQVEDYLQALVDGKASKATGLLDPNVTTDERVLLSDEVYKEAKNRPTDFSIESTEVSGDSATVKARLKQDGKWDTLTFTLLKGGKRDVVFDDWKLDSGPQARVALGTVPATVKVNGVEVELGAAGEKARTEAAGETTRLPVLPGEYTFTAPKGSKYVTYGQDVTLTKRLGSGVDNDQPVTFTTSYTNRVYTDAAAQIEEKISACTTASTLFVEGCMPASWEDTGYDATKGITRDWETQPTVTITGTADDGRTTTATSAAEASDLSGSLAATVDNAQLHVDGLVRDSQPEGDTPADWQESSGDTFDPFVDLSGERMVFPVTIKGNTLTVRGWDQLDHYDPDRINQGNRAKYSQYTPMGG